VNLAGQTALVTGASGGLGHAIARALAARGAKLVLTARRVEVLEQLAAETGGRVVAADLSDRDAVPRLVDETGPVDVLVANAGIPGTPSSSKFPAWSPAGLSGAGIRSPPLLRQKPGSLR
jgi:NADP-dependent 3-hydroxy acid dehydrogenase YdfG